MWRAFLSFRIQRCCGRNFVVTAVDLKERAARAELAVARCAFIPSGGCAKRPANRTPLYGLASLLRAKVEAASRGGLK